MKKFKNFTPHTVNIYDADGKNIILSIPVETDTDGKPVSIRVSEITEPADPINGIPTVTKSYGECIGLPPYEPGVILIVSVIVLQADTERQRSDLICPDTGTESAVRDAKGIILGVRRFQR